MILKKNKELISVGRTPPPKEIPNKHIHLNDLDNLSILDNLEFDKVIFLIGSSNHHEINNKITMGIDFNVYPTQKILNYLKNRKIKKFICFTTILLYDQFKMKLPVDENQEIDPYVNKYIFSKYLSEQIVKFYSKDVPSIIVRLSNIYGYTKLRRPDLVPTIMQDIFEKESVKIWSNKPERDFIFTEDAADAVLKLIDSDFVGTINLGSGKKHSLLEMTDIIEEISGKKIFSEDKNVSGPMKFTTDISRLQKVINWQPKFSLKNGLEKTYNVMREYYLQKR